MSVFRMTEVGLHELIVLDILKMLLKRVVIRTPLLYQFDDSHFWKFVKLVVRSG